MNLVSAAEESVVVAGERRIEIVGGLGRWATAFGALSVSGTNGDGWFLVIGGAVAILLSIRHASRRGSSVWPMVVTGLIGIGTTIVAIIDLGDISTATSSGELVGDVVNPGWGLWLSVVAAASLALASIATFWHAPRATTSPTAPVARGSETTDV